MKHTGRILSSLLLAAALFLGQAALPALGQVRAASPAAPQVVYALPEPTGNAATEWAISPLAELLYKGMPTAPLLKIAAVNGGSAPESVTWASGNEAVLKVAPVDKLQGQLTVVGAGTATIRATDAVTNTYFDLALTVAFEITDQPTNIQYDGQPHGWTVNSSSVKLTYSGSDTPPTDVGTYTVKASLNSADTEIGKLIISPKPAANIQPVGSLPPPTEKTSPTAPDTTDSFSITSTDFIEGKITVTAKLFYPSVDKPGAQKDGRIEIDASQPALKNYQIANPIKFEGLSYDGKGEVPVTVTNIEITSPPAKMEYTVGDSLDLAGMQVKLTYSNSSVSAPIPPNQFAANGITVSPAAGEKLTGAHNGKPITVTHKDKPSAETAALTVKQEEQRKTKPEISVSLPSAGKGGDKVTVTVRFNRKDSKADYPSADKFTLTDSRNPSQTPALSRGPGDTYIATYTLPNEDTAIELTLAFAGDENFEGAGAKSNKITVSKVSAEKPVPTLEVSADKASFTGAGTVKLTVRFTVPAGAPALPAAKDIALKNDRGLTMSGLSGENGAYTTSCELPNATDTVTFTASFGGDTSFAAAKDASCTVNVTYAGSNKGSEVEAAIGKLTAANQVSSLSDTQKAALEKQVRSIIANIASLADGQKRSISDASLIKLDALLTALTGVTPQSATLSSYYTGGGNRIQDGAAITGALAAANAAGGDRIALNLDQRRNGSSRTFLQVDLSLKKNGSNVTLQTPVIVTIPLPSGYVKRSGVELRHRKSGGGYEYPSFTIHGDRGSYQLTFRATSFSLYTLYLPERDTNDRDDDGSFDQYTITAKAGKGGTISPSGDVRVDRGSNKTFTVKASSGYAVDTVLIDGSKKVSLKDGKYTFEDVDEPYSIEVTFKRTTAQASSAAASSAAQTSSKTQTSRPTTPTTSTAAPAPSSSRAPSSQPEPSSEESSSEPESSSSEESSSPEESSSSEESSSEPATPTGNDSDGGMSDADLTVAVVIIVVVIALSLAAIFFGVYLSRKRDEEEDDEEEE